jgi:sugar lactone lactonase YvrE
MADHRALSLALSGLAWPAKLAKISPSSVFRRKCMPGSAVSCNLLSMKLLLLPVFVALACCASLAQGTKLWTQQRFDEFEKGTPKGVAIRSNGLLEPGPESRQLAMTPSTYIWALATDSAGNAYTATGSPATVLRIAPDGKITKLFTSKDLSVQAIAVAKDGSVYAGTLPSGKVYKLPAGAADLDETKATAVFDPAQTEARPKYIWALVFDSTGRLYIATGAPAAIYRLDPASANPKPEPFFKSDEQHIRALAFDKSGNLIAGSDGSGLIYRIDNTGKGYVLFDAPRHEITSLSIADDGAIYAAGVGSKGQTTLPPLPVQGTPSVSTTITFVQPGSVQAFNGNTVIPDGSEVYQIAPHSAPRKIWSDRDDIVYSLRWTPQGLLAATGNRGRIYRIEDNGDYADIAHLEASQAVGFADSPQGLLVATANPGKVYLLSHAPAAESTYLSNVFDAGVFSQWGRAEVDSNGSDYEIFARAGNIENPERAWSDWKKITPNLGPLGLEQARFLQWKIVLHPGTAVSSVAINYLPVNVAPVIDEIAVVPGARVPAPPPQQLQNQPIAISFGEPSRPPVQFNEQGHEPLTGIRDKSAVTVRWAAHDDNGDDLIYSLYYRGDGDKETNWQLLKDKVSERYFSFDATTFPDGAYRLKVVASDAPSHNPGDALTAEKVSDRFVLDTTPPSLSTIEAHLVNGRIHVVLTATDTTSPISHAEYSVDSGPWQYLEPVGKLSDSLTEHYDFDAVVPQRQQGFAPQNPSEHLITVRVYDRYDNVAAAKAVVR